MKMRERDDEHRKCNACSQAASSTEVKTRYCNGCKEELTQTHFADNQWYRVGAGSRKCMECSFGPRSPNVKGRWTCVRYSCKKTLPKELFSRWMQDKKKERRDNTQICNECFTKEKQERDAQNLSNRLAVQKFAQKKK